MNGDVRVPSSGVRRRRNTRRMWLFVTGLFMMVFLFVFMKGRFGEVGSGAASLAGFDPGYIISDYQMGRYDAMSEAEIQAWLSAKNSCPNTNYALYQQLSASTTLATWHFKDGHFVCISEELFGDGQTIGSGETAAHIIWQAAQDYKINPQVLLVLLQKENTLITDDVPNSWNYRTATGYGCPDTAACSSKYYGFKNQIRWAAALFHDVLYEGITNYPLGNNIIAYGPFCSESSVVNIKNLATSALYRYTPYQPSSAVLAAGYGTVGGVCSAYGNRNFHLFFEDWFGGIKDEVPDWGNLVKRMEKVADVETAVDFEYNAYIEKYGWPEATVGGKMLGTTGQSLRMEGFTMKLADGVGVEYRTHIQNYGWESTYKKDGEASGAPGSGLRLEAVQIRLYGEMAEKYDVSYRVHVQDIGWMDWVSNDAVAGTTGQSKKIEAIQVMITKRADLVELEYKAHVQDIGWMSSVVEGELAGTTGQSKRVEAIVINVIGNVEGGLNYRAHVQDYGWLNPVTDGEVMGTTGQSKRVEAIVIEPTGELAEKYNVIYRVHVQDYGWMNWVSNGAVAGTTGQSKRIEAIEVKLVKK